MHRTANDAKRPPVMLIRMWKLLLQFDPLAPGGAVRNVATVLDTERRERAEVDSVVDRLHRHAVPARPAA